MPFEDVDAFLKAEGAASPEVRSLRRKILVVDDDPTIRKSLATLLGGRFEVVLCESAKEAVDAVSDDCHAVILDVKMGKYDGFWACDQIRKMHVDIPIIFYSAYQDAKDPYHIINDHRPFGYITKNGDIKLLLKAVDLATEMYARILAGKQVLENHKSSRT